MEENLTKIVEESRSFTEVIKKLGKFPNTHNIKKLRIKLLEKNINFNHFTTNGKVVKLKSERKCPICGDVFIPEYNEKQVTCSYGCSNTFFARKRNKPENYKSYKTICWYHHGKKCILCGEDKIVEVHHMDENHKNNNPKNLVPLCPTHHQYWHSRYRDVIRKRVDDYISSQCA
jgi:hypothetical protein